MIGSRSVLTSLLSLALVACGAPEGSDTAPSSTGGGEAQRAAREVTVPAGTEVVVTLQSTLNSGSNEIGDIFLASVGSPVVADGHTAIPAGSQVTGEVTEVHAAKRGAGHGQLTLTFTGVRLPDGDTYPLVASMSTSTEGKKKRNAAIIGGSAAGGAVLGRAAGDDAKDAAVGAIIGGAIGTAVVLAQEGEQVNLPAGTQLVLHLDQPLSVPSAA